FVSTVSHELRTPLTSISGYVELARERADTESRGYLAIVERNAERLLALVNDLLFVARIQSGGLELQFDRLDMAELMAESVAAAARRRRSTGRSRVRVSASTSRSRSSRRPAEPSPRKATWGRGPPS